MRCIRRSGPVPDDKHGELWFLTFENIDYIEFRKWAEDAGVRYRFTWESNRVQMFTETDALICYLSFL